MGHIQTNNLTYLTYLTYLTLMTHLVIIAIDPNRPFRPAKTLFGITFFFPPKRLSMFATEN